MDDIELTDETIMFAFATDGYGHVFLTDGAGHILGRADLTTDDDTEFKNAATWLIKNFI